jgi:uncharacterized heparinase superfamily protein
VTGEELALLGRTAAHLRPAQVAHRARLRAQRTALHRWPQAGQWLLAGPLHGGPDPARAPGWPPEFTPLDGTALTVTAPPHWPTLAQLQAGRIQLLGVTRPLGRDGRPGAAWSGPGRLLADWRQAGAPQLWRFHLHYWDWAWGLATERDRGAAREQFARLWRSWRAACDFGQGDAWRPYPAALRAWSWCGLYRDLVAGTALAAEFRRDLAAHAAFLRRHLESDVGGNHLVKNLKALAGLGVFLADEALLRRAVRLLAGQLAVQVLPDGGHFECAPAYHCQVLADLIDVSGLLSASGCVPPPALTGAIARMRRWLGVVLLPDGGVPLLNDGYPVPGALAAALRPVPPPGRPLLALADTGLIRAAVGDWHLLADAGPPCPDELPAHAHADTLGCVLYAGGAPLLVETGTSTYAAGPARAYERSTAAHNTVQIDGADSTEVWGAFRAGRRARVRGPVVRVAGGRVIAHAAHDGYRFLPGRPRHRRRWSLGRDGLEVTDEVTGGGRHAVVVRWHLASGSEARLTPGGATVATAAGHFAMAVSAAQPFRIDMEAAPAAVGFLRTTTIPVLTCRLDAALPVRLTTSWRRASDDSPARRPG